MLYAKATTKKSPKELDTSRTASILKPAITATTDGKSICPSLKEPHSHPRPVIPTRAIVPNLYRTPRTYSEIMCDKRKAKSCRKFGDGDRTSRFQPIRVVCINGVGPLIPEDFDLIDFAVSPNLNSIRQRIAPKNRADIIFLPSLRQF